jgi:hypothetical protein
MSDWNYLNNLKPGKSGYKRNNFSRPQLMVFALVFGLVGFLIFKSFAAPNPSLPGDLNNDNTVNVTDLSVLLSNYGTSNSAADINTDGTVNILDMSILLSHYGQSYSPPPVSSSIYWGALNTHPWCTGASRSPGVRPRSMAARPTLLTTAARLMS